MGSTQKVTCWLQRKKNVTCLPNTPTCKVININNITSSTWLNDIQPPQAHTGVTEEWNQPKTCPWTCFLTLVFFLYLIYYFITNIMAYTTTRQHDYMTTWQQPPPHGHLQGWWSDMEIGGRLRQWEMAQTTPDMFFGPLVSVFLFPFILNDTNACNSMFVKYTAFYLDTMQYGNRWKTMTMGNGPNDTRHVVWALVGVFYCFPFIFLCEYMFYCIFRFQHTMWYGDRWKAMTLGNGPNDARHVVWALGECISFFLRFYWY